MGRRSEVIYALYRGEDNLGDGTLKELVEKFGLTENTLRYLAGKTYRKRCGGDLKNKMVVIRVGKKGEV